MAVKFYLESRPSKRTGESAIRASFSIKGVKLITTTGISINDENWSDETAVEARTKEGGESPRRIIRMRRGRR